MTETDGAMFRERMDAAEIALQDRLRELWNDGISSPQEHLALHGARMCLELLRREAKRSKQSGPNLRYGAKNGGSRQLLLNKLCSRW
jgi:hypothetical protein